MELQCRMNRETGVFSIILQPGVMLDFQKLSITERIPGLAPCRVEIREELRFLDYYVAQGRPLSELLRRPMAREAFLALGQQLTTAGLVLESAGISQELSAEPETIFLSERGVLFCYIPIEGYKGGGFRRLFQQILARGSFSGVESGWLQPIRQYLQTHTVFSVKEFQGLLQTMGNRTAGGYYVPQAASTGQTSAKGGTVLISDAVQFRNQAAAVAADFKIEEARQAEEARKTEEARQAEEARKAEEVRQAEEARKAEEARRAEEARKAAEARQAEEARKAEEVRQAEEARKAEEARQAEEARKVAVQKKGFLIYSQTGEKIPLEGPVVRIGKRKDSVDYCISGNPAVSRHHADILHREDAYFLVDRNSLNKTYVNGKEIEPQKEIRLSSQDRISFADEIFVFVFED